MSEPARRILMLDDDEDEFVIVRRLLGQTRQRYQLEWTPDPERALEDMRRGAHHVYLVDYRLGMLTGVEVIRQAVDAGVKAPLILLTGTASDDGGIDIEALRSGAADYLSKDGLTVGALERSVRYALERVQAATLRESLGRAREESAQLQAALTKLESQTRRLQLLAEMSTVFSQAQLDLELTLRELAQHCADALEGSCAVTLADESATDAVIRAFHHVDPAAQRLGEQLLVGKHVPFEQSMIGVLLREGQPRLLPALTGAELASLGFSEPMLEFNARYQACSILLVPLRISGNLLGALAVMRYRSGSTFTGDDQSLLQDIVDRAAMAIQSALLFQAQVDARRVAERAVRLRDEFLAIASHELKTPLTSLRIQAQMFARSLRTGDASVYQPARVNKLIEQADKQTGRLSKLVEDMLDLTRIQTGKLMLELAPTSLDELTADVLERLKPAMLAAGVEPVLAVSERVEGRWDRLRLEQVVANLLTNAMRYGQSKPVEIRVERRDEVARLSVKDQGLGLHPEDRERIFLRYERAVSKNEVSGLGIGLFISQQIVRAHGGRIWAESPGPGQGSTFIVELPVAERPGEAG